jgi:hypothetical protein
MQTDTQQLADAYDAALGAEGAARARREEKRPFISTLRAMIDRVMNERFAPDDFLELLRSLTSADASLQREVLLELEALRARLDEKPLRLLAEARREIQEDDLAAGRAVLLLAGFTPEELSDEVVRQILEYAPLLIDLGREAGARAR